MKPGDVSQPIRTARGYQILKLETTTGAQTMTFEQAREQISDHVSAGKRQQEFLKLLEKLRAEGDHRVQERGHQEGVRTGARAAKTSGPHEPVLPDTRPSTRLRAPIPGARSPDRRARRSGSRSGRGRATSRSSASSSSASTSTRSCRPSRAGAGGRIARRRSTGRCFPAIASRASIRPTPSRFSSAPASSTSCRSRGGRRRFPSTSSTASAS